MIEAVNDKVGDILKFGGDALLILFGGPDHSTPRVARPPRCAPSSLDH